VRQGLTDQPEECKYAQAFVEKRRTYPCKDLLKSFPTLQSCYQDESAIQEVVEEPRSMNIFHRRRI
jgi:hypothetical protein